MATAFYSSIDCCCRICEVQTTLIDISANDNKTFLDQYLACANVTVRYHLTL